jgi:hypothetical protein
MQRTKVILFALLFIRIAPAQVTAREVIERIRQHVGVPWREQTVDSIKAAARKLS